MSDDDTSEGCRVDEIVMQITLLFNPFLTPIPSPLSIQAFTEEKEKIGGAARSRVIPPIAVVMDTFSKLMIMSSLMLLSPDVNAFLTPLKSHVPSYPISMHGK